MRGAGRLESPPGGEPCNWFDTYGIQSAEEQVNSVTAVTYTPTIWFVVAAWPENKQWCGVEFGFADYAADLFAFYEYLPCFPGNGLEIPSPDWPGPNTGMACATTNEPWEGNYQNVYYFFGYAYGYGQAGILPLAQDPVTGFAGFANCLHPPELFEPDCLGGLGVNMPGIDCAPDSCPPSPVEYASWGRIKSLYR